MCSKYFPLINRVTTRNELSDLIGSFVGELAALHASVHGGDEKTETNKIMVASLGVMFSRDKKANGFKIEYIYKVDQDYPDEKSSLDDPYLDVNIGDIITKVNGKDALFAIDIGALLRN
jgi:tricorn protease